MTEWVDEDELTITYKTLRQAMAEAQLAERERIVALLESVAYLVLEEDDEDGDVSTLEREEFIALIRGEES